MLIAPLQSDAQDGSAHSVITLEKPASLPPIVYVTQLVSEVTLATWVLRMSPVFAPEQARARTSMSGWALCSRYGYA